MLPPPRTVVLLHLRVGPILYVIPKQVSRKLKGPQRILPPFKGEHLEGAGFIYLSQEQIPRLPHGWQKISSLCGYPQYDRVDHSGNRVL